MPSGRLQYFYSSWKKLNVDPTVWSWIQGYMIPFISQPYQTVSPNNKCSNPRELKEFDTEIVNLLNKGAISVCEREQGDYLSSVFLVPKPNGDKRFILNLKNLNNFIKSVHFKMEDLRTAIKLISPGFYLATIDLQDAYFLVPIHPNHKKYLRFEFQHRVYEFNCLPFGLSSAPLVFTKIMKPVMEHLRLHGYISTIYLDDILLIGRSYTECVENVNVTRQLLNNLGFLINLKKSSMEPKTSCKFLGFILDTKQFCVKLPQEKRKRIKKEIETIRNTKSCKIRVFAKFIGLLISVCPAIEYGWLHTKIFEREKFINLLKHNDYEKFMILNKELINEDLDWWYYNIDQSISPIRNNIYEFEFFSDASKTGWGASFNNEKIHGFWTEDEKHYHINILEMLAAFFALKTFATNVYNTQILLRIDNTTAISCINRMGSVQYPHLNKISREIWHFCEQRKLIVFASYIKSCDNTVADFESRRNQSDTEWELAHYAFSQIVDSFGMPEIDLFASRSNTKTDRYISWKPDPYAYCIDAFTVSWSNLFFYAFPPFAVILKSLNKIIVEKSYGILVVPFWPTQPWFPIFKKLVASNIIYFQPSSDLLISGNSRSVHLHQNLTLAAAILSGKRY